MLNKKKNNKGFTLVELLVVIAIIGILAVVAVPSLMKNLDKGKTAQVMANINAIRTEVMSEYANGVDDTAVVAALNTYISSTITDKKFSESYAVEDAGTATDGAINITVTLTNRNEIAESIAKQLGTNASADNGKVTFSVTK